MAFSMPLLDCSFELKALSRSKVRWASAMSLAGKPQPGRTGQRVNNVSSAAVSCHPNTTIRYSADAAQLKSPYGFVARSGWH